MITSTLDMAQGQVGSRVGAGPSAYVLVGMFVSCILYGVFGVLFCGTIYVLCYKRSASRLNLTLFIASVSIFVLTTFGLVITCFRTFNGLIRYRNVIDPDIFFVEFTWDWIVNTAIDVATQSVADATLIYRCWAVWGHRCRIVAFNVLLWLLGFASGVVLLVRLSTTDPFDNATVVALNTWNMIFVTLTLTQNIIATGLTAIRLWRVDAAAAAYRQGSLMPVMWILVESGGLYVAILVVYMAVDAVASSATFIASLMINPIIGIAFSLIIVRVGLGLTMGSSYPSTVGRQSPQVNNVHARYASPVSSIDSTTHNSTGGDTPQNSVDGTAGFHGIHEAQKATGWDSQKELGNVEA